MCLKAKLLGLKICVKICIVRAHRTRAKQAVSKMPVVKIFKGIFTIKLKMISMFFFSVIFTNKIKAKLYAPIC